MVNRLAVRGDGGYLLQGVVDKGLMPVYQLRGSSCGAIAANVVNIATLGNVPPGCTVFNTNGQNVLLNTSGGNISLTGWDLRGFALSFDCPIGGNARTFTLTDCLIQADPSLAVANGFPALTTGGNNDGATLDYGTGTFTRCTFYGDTNLQPTPLWQSPRPASGTFALLMSNTTFNYCKFLNTGLTTMAWGCIGKTVTLNYCYFNCFGQKLWTDTDGNYNSHTEWGIVSAGNMILNNCCLDALDGAENMKTLAAPHQAPHNFQYAPTGCFLVQGNASNAYLELNNCVVLMRDVANTYAFQVGLGASNSTLYVNGCVLQSGLNGFNIPPSGVAGWLGTGGTFTIYGQNNVDQAGVAITAINSYGPPP